MYRLNRVRKDGIIEDLKAPMWPNNPVTSRLALGSDNSAELGWLIFDNKQ